MKFLGPTRRKLLATVAVPHLRPSAPPASVLAQRHGMSSGASAASSSSPWRRLAGLAGLDAGAARHRLAPLPVVRRIGIDERALRLEAIPPVSGRAGRRPASRQWARSGQCAQGGTSLAPERERHQIHFHLRPIPNQAGHW